MIFIVLIKWKQAPKKEIVDKATKTLEEQKKRGIKMRVYWTMGRYDAVTIMEAPNEKEATKTILRFQGIVDTETMVAIPREEAIKLL
ncbi:MAG: GYD domain-containing protein [Candidatus Bathyarchaeota archaeon]|nr:MAG: GYD domain-containing protein [Candidatus Bathyarchaeota archaeon]